MKYLKKINEFSETGEGSYWSNPEVKEFIKEFMEDNNIYGSFSSGGYFRESGEHVGMLKDFLHNKGIDLDKFMKDNWDEIMDDDFFVSKNGFMDCLLYNYDRKYPLSGGKMYEGDITTKYKYGYHNYDLGRAYIKQNFESLGEYFELYLEEKFKEENVDKDSYFINKIDNSNVFVFIATSMNKNFNFSELLDIDDGIFEIANGIYFLNLGTIGIRNEEELAEYYDYEKVIDDLKMRANAKKYNV